MNPRVLVAPKKSIIEVYPPGLRAPAPELSFIRPAMILAPAMPRFCPTDMRPIAVPKREGATSLFVNGHRTAGTKEKLTPINAVANQRVQEVHNIIAIDRGSRSAPNASIGAWRPVLSQIQPNIGVVNRAARKT